MKIALSGTHVQRPTSHSLQGWQVDKSGITATSQEVNCLKVAWNFGFVKGQKTKQCKEPSLMHDRESLSRTFLPYRGPVPIERPSHSLKMYSRFTKA